MLYLWCVLNECFVGGLAGFRQSHDDLCEHSLHLEEGQHGGTAVPHSLPSTPDIENADLTAILPSLYLGNERDAQDLELMQRMDIGFILNVTTHLPLYHYELGLFKYKRFPATDSNKQNLRQYFEEAFEFIGTTAELCRRKTCHEYFKQEDNLAERESGLILLQQKTNVFIYLFTTRVCVCAFVYIHIHK